MHPAISYPLATARIADLHRQAQRAGLARTAAPVPDCAPQPDGNRVLVSLRRAVRHRFGEQLWTVLHAQALLDGPASPADDSYRRSGARRESR